MLLIRLIFDKKIQWAVLNWKANKRLEPVKSSLKFKLLSFAYQLISIFWIGTIINYSISLKGMGLGLWWIPCTIITSLSAGLLVKVVWFFYDEKLKDLSIYEASSSFENDLYELLLIVTGKKKGQKISVKDLSLLHKGPQDLPPYPPYRCCVKFVGHVIALAIEIIQDSDVVLSSRFPGSETDRKIMKINIDLEKARLKEILSIGHAFCMTDLTVQQIYNAANAQIARQDIQRLASGQN